MKRDGNDSAETVLKRLDESHSKYKFMEYNLNTKKARSEYENCRFHMHVHFVSFVIGYIVLKLFFGVYWFLDVNLYSPSNLHNF